MERIQELVEKAKERGGFKEPVRNYQYLTHAFQPYEQFQANIIATCHEWAPRFYVGMYF